MKVEDIRKLFSDAYKVGTENPTVEILGASFEADEAAIFGTPDQNYIDREISWYESNSRNVNDFPGGAPTIWKSVASPAGMINSNYGYLIWSPQNGRQYLRVRQELETNPASRRATMIYTRPSMHYDYYTDGMSDFVCTNAVSYYIRDNLLHAVVQMRSNDAVYGYKNDRAWQLHVMDLLCKDLKISRGTLHWQVQNLHVYSRHYKFIEEYATLHHTPPRKNTKGNKDGK